MRPRPGGRDRCAAVPAWPPCECRCEHPWAKPTGRRACPRPPIRGVRQQEALCARGAAARTSAQPRRRAGTQGRSSLPSTPCEQIAHDRAGNSICRDSSGRLLALSRKRRLRRAPSATQRLARAYAAPLPLLAPARIEPARRMTICWKLVRPGAGRQHAAAGALVSCPRQA